MRKMNNKAAIFIILIVSVSIIWFISSHIYSFHGNKIERITIVGKKFDAEVVSGNAKLQKGLGGRNGLCDSCAMLFKFPSPEKYTFWMKGMRFPLDIIWLKDKEIVHIEKNVSENFLGILTPQSDADSVLEINAGNVDKFGIEIGQMVEL